MVYMERSGRIEHNLQSETCSIADFSCFQTSGQKRSTGQAFYGDRGDVQGAFQAPLERRHAMPTALARDAMPCHAMLALVPWGSNLLRRWLGWVPGGSNHLRIWLEP